MYIINVKKILAVINATYAVAKRKPEKIRLAGTRTLTSAIYETHIFELRNEEINVKKIVAVINATIAELGETVSITFSLILLKVSTLSDDHDLVLFSAVCP